MRFASCLCIDVTITLQHTYRLSSTHWKLGPRSYWRNSRKRRRVTTGHRTKHWKGQARRLSKTEITSVTCEHFLFLIACQYFLELDSSGPRLAAHLFFFPELSSTEQGLIAVFQILAVWKIFASPLKLLKCAWAHCDKYDINDCIVLTLKNFVWRFIIWFAALFSSCSSKTAAWYEHPNQRDCILGSRT